MSDAYSFYAKLAFAATVAAGLAGCAGAPKEKTAPCKRPANLTSFVEDPRKDCGSMTSVNGDPSAALAAIDTMAAE
ncbi:MULTISPECIES: hypothetical protein [Agrobacterium]|uniref:hypothetical protein n=1 Tax=Agrobacterium TaxID=357 RepID=UPI0009BABCD5|nr:MULTISPECIES: hypothetical protein [Agrobacterium]QCL77444.1 hypothetical protein CFBP5499_28750 [Agrobacterium tumefaciens]CUX72284.1 conserved exported hypothetical protein [Agrobacterium sp. NCPPB 925]